MDKLKREDLMSLETYAEQRSELRTRVMVHKKNRHVAVGPNATLQFEDRLTMQYQIQEMLRIERIFDRAGIEEELAAYNPLIPDGTNWKATFMVEFDDPQERKHALGRLIGIEDAVWVRVGDGERVYAVADEDMERETEEKTSAVHFLRFELPAPACIAARKGAAIAMGIDHPEYHHEIGAVAEAVRAALAADLD
ncbi:MAG: DUF3501 family protein [Gammaproteobacteria bacterium]|nr:DUF3501 family protein [Gammaproteobacteria bacterium]